MLRCIDLFARVGGFRYAMQAAEEAGLAADFVFSSEIDRDCQQGVYSCSDIK